MRNIQATRFNQIAKHPLQTWEWGEFRQAWGNKVVRIKSKNKETAQIILSKIPFTSYKIGTHLKGARPSKEILNELRLIGKKEKVIFIKIEPNLNQDSLTANEHRKTIQLLKKNKCVKGKSLFTPTTFWLDLTKSEEELLKSFSSKTRYNIRYAQRKGVKIIEDNSPQAFSKYLQLTKETVQRQAFFAHTQKYHRLMWKHLHQIPVSKHQTPIAHLLTAKYKNEVITTWIVFLWKDFLYYPYGASSEKYKNVMANNLMLWEAIRFGKNKGCKTFDLWGREPGKGFTRFKEGYHPKIIKFIGTWDLVIYPYLYWLYRITEYFRWLILKIPAKLGLIKPKF